MLLSPANTPVVPSAANDLFAPLGNEVRVFYTNVYEDGTQEPIPQGVFGIDDLDIDHQGKDLIVTLDGADRAAEVIAAGFGGTVTVAPATNVGAAIQLLMSQAVVTFPWQFNFAPTTAVTPLTPLIFTPATDAFTEGRKLARAIGFDLYFDIFGWLTFLPVPDPTVASLAWVYDGSPGNTASLMDEVKRKLSRTSTPNYIIRDGTGAGIPTPFRVVAQDLNPLSPTFVGGKYGVRRNYQSSNLYANPAQAQVAADTDLLLGMGALEAVEIKAAPKPDHDIDDVISLTDPVVGVTLARYVVDGFTMGFGAQGVIDMIGRTIAGVQ